MPKADINGDMMSLGVLTKALTQLYSDGFFAVGEKLDLIDHPFWHQDLIANPITFIRYSHQSGSPCPFIFIDNEDRVIRLHESGLQYLRRCDNAN